VFSLIGLVSFDFGVDLDQPVDFLTDTKGTLLEGIALESLAKSHRHKAEEGTDEEIRSILRVNEEEESGSDSELIDQHVHALPEDLAIERLSQDDRGSGSGSITILKSL
jgi:hypothetical protein